MNKASLAYKVPFYLSSPLFAGILSEMLFSQMLGKLAQKVILPTKRAGANPSPAGSEPDFHIPHYLCVFKRRHSNG